MSLTTEAEIQRLTTEEGRRFKLIESSFGNRYIDVETGSIFITQEQQDQYNRLLQERALPNGTEQEPEQRNRRSIQEKTDPLERIKAKQKAEQEAGSLEVASNQTSKEEIARQLAPEQQPPRPNKPPGSGMLRPTIVESLLSQDKKKFLEDYPRENARTSSGFNNTRITEPIPVFNSTDTEKVIHGPSNSFIVLGRDRPGSEFSGKGAGANTHVACIDIIAGLGGILAREVDDQGNKVLSNKSTELDAARIYISQRADIDSPEYFNLAEGNVGNITNRSAIAIKADSVRLIGREGIKLVTSTDTYNGASGMFIGDNIQGIDLIAGNDDSDLQPMVKGDHLAKILDDLLEITTHVHGSVYESLELISLLLGLIVTTDPKAAASPLFNNIALRMTKALANLATQEKNFVKHQLNYSEKNPIAKYNFRSKYNNVN